MASVPTTDHQQRIDLRQRLYVLAIFAVLASHITGVVLTSGATFEWSSLILGIVSAVGLPYLGNRVYGGDKSALPAIRWWLAVQVVIVGFGLCWFVAGLTHPDLARHLGITA